MTVWLPVKGGTALSVLLTGVTWGVAAAGSGVLDLWRRREPVALIAADIDFTYIKYGIAHRAIAELMATVVYWGDRGGCQLVFPTRAKKSITFIVPLGCFAPASGVAPTDSQDPTRAR